MIFTLYFTFCLTRQDIALSTLSELNLSQLLQLLAFTQMGERCWTAWYMCVTDRTIGLT